MGEAVRPLTPDLFESAAELLAEAFFTNPAHTYFCPDPRRRRGQLEWLLGGNLRLQPDLRASFCLTEGRVVEAMGFWTRSTAAKVGTLRQIRGGLLAAPVRLGWANVRRLFEVLREVDRHLELSLGDRPYWYLNNMVVREHLRGSGVGTRLLREQLPIVAEREPAWEIALSTQRPENVTFYQRLGFEPVLEQVIGNGPGAFRNWVMVRAPASAQPR
jgi:GNAT superfamily N-acetyltransferase